MTRNYELVYYVEENVGIIGILAYPKCIVCLSMYIGHGRSLPFYEKNP